MPNESKTPVWKMVKEAVESLSGKTTNVAVRDWILQKYSGTNPSTIACHIMESLEIIKLNVSALRHSFKQLVITHSKTPPFGAKGNLRFAKPRRRLGEGWSVASRGNHIRPQAIIQCRFLILRLVGKTKMIWHNHRRGSMWRMSARHALGKPTSCPDFASGIRRARKVGPYDAEVGPTSATKSREA